MVGSTQVAAAALRAPAYAPTRSEGSVLFEVLDAYAARGRVFPIACCLYPTAPFVRTRDLAAGKAALLDGSFDAIMPVAPFTYPIWRSLRREATGRIAPNFPEHLNARSQDLPTAYHDAGQWYWFRVAAFRREGTLMGPNAGSVLLSPAEVQDIETEEDWALAEMKHERMFG